MSLSSILGILIAGGATCLGAVPIFFKKEFSKNTLDIGLGFSAGVMLVASFLSLILPGIEAASKTYHHWYSFPIVLLGVTLGYLFIIGIHELLPHEHIFKDRDMKKGQSMNRITLILLAISLHNIPEGLAVGVGFGGGNEASGFTLAMAIAIQNMPEGLVVAFGVLREGASKKKAFLLACLSGAIEPVAAVFGYVTSSISSETLPFALAFAGGTMLFVICQEIFPELFRQGHERHATMGVLIGIMTMFAINHYF